MKDDFMQRIVSHQKITLAGISQAGSHLSIDINFSSCNTVTETCLQWSLFLTPVFLGNDETTVVHFP